MMTEAARPTPMIRFAALALLLAASCSGRSQDPDIRVTDAWARETAPGQTSAAAYLTISNRGGADRLVAAAAPEVAAEASLHRSSMSGGIARMRPISGGLDVPAEGQLRLEPEGAHVMLTKLTRPLREGETIELALRFERAGERRIAMAVVAAGRSHRH